MKKTICLSLIFLTSLSFAFECNTYEAQVMGSIEKVQVQSETCFYRVKVNQIQEHQICPLHDVEIEATEIEDPTCTYKEGDNFGKIVVDNGVKFFFD